MERLKQSLINGREDGDFEATGWSWRATAKPPFPAKCLFLQERTLKGGEVKYSRKL